MTADEARKICEASFGDTIAGKCTKEMLEHVHKKIKDAAKNGYFAIIRPFEDDRSPINWWRDDYQHIVGDILYLNGFSIQYDKGKIFSVSWASHN